MYKRSDKKYLNPDNTRNDTPLPKDSYYTKDSIKTVMQTVILHGLETAASELHIPQWVILERLSPFKSFTTKYL